MELERSLVSLGSQLDSMKFGNTAELKVDGKKNQGNRKFSMIKRLPNSLLGPSL